MYYRYFNPCYIGSGQFSKCLNSVLDVMYTHIIVVNNLQHLLSYNHYEIQQLQYVNIIDMSKWPDRLTNVPYKS